MKDNELSMLLSKFASNHHIRHLSVIIESSSRFQAFAQANSKKIGKKIRDAAKDKAVLDEKLSDVYFEIFAAHLFLQQNFVSEVIYEKYGEKGESAPDYTVHCRSGLAFNVEVKRIRAVCLERQFEAWEDKIKQFIRSIESPLAIKLVFNDRQGCFLLKYENDLVGRLENHLNNIQISIRDILEGPGNSVSVDSIGEFPISLFGRELLAEISRPSGKRSSQTAWNGTARPVFYSQGAYLDKGEYKRFSDLICEPKPLKQMRVGMVNLLVILSGNETHEEIDLDAAVSSIHERLQERNERFFKHKRFNDIDDFSNYFKNLSGVMFKSTYNPLVTLGCNENAVNQIPDYLREKLRTI